MYSRRRAKLILLAVPVYLLYVRQSLNTRRRSENQPLILIWNGYQEDDSLWGTVFQRITSGECGVRCRVTRDRSLINDSSAILFHLPNLHWEGYHYPSYRDPSIPWILMSYESANSIRERAGNWGRYPGLRASHFTTEFNRTLTLRRDSDLVARHGLVRRRITPLSAKQLEKLYSQEPSQDFANYTQENFSAERTGNTAPVVWFVSHCHDYNGRMKYVRRLQRHIGVHIYGECGNLKCGKTRNMRAEYSTERDPCFDLVNRKYKFYLSFENALCKDYVTEKAFNALGLNTIPVVFGGADYADIFPPKSYIDALLFPDPASLASHLYSLLQSPLEFSSYFTWRPHYEVVSYVSVPDNCQLCERLVAGDLAQYKVYPNMWDWLVRRSQCVFTRRSWSTEKFMRVWESQREKRLA